jgi:hypothetical protein
MRINLNRTLALVFIVIAFIGGFAFGAPPQRPGPLQRPPLREVVGESPTSFQWVVTSSDSPAVEIVKKAKATKTRCCSDACTCGCVEGGECKCAAASPIPTPWVLPPSPPRPVPLPYYGTPIQGFQQTYSSPGIPMGFSSRSFGGAACSSGG